jgi:predicted DNA-binding mobile mystery protein A
MQNHHLKLLQTDKNITPWRVASQQHRPNGGWLRSIREALGMSATALARRLNMSQAAISKFETAEQNDAITLGSLRKLAAAMDCELHYALVPRLPLHELLSQQAQRVAKQRLAPTAHSMSLEAQSVSSNVTQQQLEGMTQRLLAGSRRELW